MRLPAVYSAGRVQFQRRSWSHLRFVYTVWIYTHKIRKLDRGTKELRARLLYPRGIWSETRMGRRKMLGLWRFLWTWGWLAQRTLWSFFGIANIACTFRFYKFCLVSKIVDSISIVHPLPKKGMIQHDKADSFLQKGSHTQKPGLVQHRHHADSLPLS